MVKKKYKGKADIPAIIESLRVAEEYIASANMEDQKIGASMKSLFGKVLAKRRQELQEAIEKSAKAKKTKFWREK
ncbi:MAG: hypothetical protein WCG28_04630 [bacterium]